MTRDDLDELAEIIVAKVAEKLSTKTGPIKWTELDRQIARDAGTVVAPPPTPDTPFEEAILRRIRWW